MYLQGTIKIRVLSKWIENDKIIISNPPDKSHISKIEINKYLQYKFYKEFYFFIGHRNLNCDSSGGTSIFFSKLLIICIYILCSDNNKLNGSSFW